jgi:hypothetical protein
LGADDNRTRGVSDVKTSEEIRDLPVVEAVIIADRGSVDDGTISLTGGAREKWHVREVGEQVALWACVVLVFEPDVSASTYTVRASVNADAGPPDDNPLVEVELSFEIDAPRDLAVLGVPHRVPLTVPLAFAVRTVGRYTFELTDARSDQSLALRVFAVVAQS